MQNQLFIWKNIKEKQCFSSTNKKHTFNYWNSITVPNKQVLKVGFFSGLCKNANFRALLLPTPALHEGG